MIGEILTRDYGWFFAIAVVCVATFGMFYAAVLIRDELRLLKAVRAAGQNGVLAGLVKDALKSFVVCLAHLALFANSGYIVLGVVIAGAPPEGALLSLSRLTTLINVSLMVWWLRAKQASRRDLANQAAN